MNPMMLVMLLVVGGMMFMTSRKQKQAQADRQNSLNAIQPGDEIITIGGLHGTFHEEDVAKGTITLDCEGVFLVFEKSAIKSVKPAVSNMEEEPAQEETIVEDAPEQEDDFSNQDN